MGLEPVILLVWLIAVTLGAGLCAVALWRRQWFSAFGTVLGLAVGLFPVVVFKGPQVLGAMAALSVGAAPLLVLAYAIRKRNQRAMFGFCILVLPLIYTISVPRDQFRAGWPGDWLRVAGELAFLCGPIVCLLAGRELFSIFQRDSQGQVST